MTHAASARAIGRMDYARAVTSAAAFVACAPIDTHMSASLVELVAQRCSIGDLGTKRIEAALKSKVSRKAV